MAYKFKASRGKWGKEYKQKTREKIEKKENTVIGKLNKVTKISPRGGLSEGPP